LAGQEKDTGGGTGWQGWRREKETVFSSVHVEYKMPGELPGQCMEWSQDRAPGERGKQSNVITLKKKLAQIKICE
jgi:hypothetical protein